MPNRFYTQAAPRTTADTTGNSRKGQRGGWRATSTKTASNAPGAAASGWICNTRKATGIAGYGSGGGAKVTSTRKQASGSGWTISSTKGR